jgi:hypothetical protein
MLEGSLLSQLDAIKLLAVGVHLQFDVELSDIMNRAWGLTY